MTRAEREKGSLSDSQGVDVPALPGRVVGGRMNWMTSGRKRVQRSQKVKELRAKHFAKVAADRARAPVSRPGRASSSALNQSADVSRLKSRWTQQLPSTHKVSALQRTVAGSAAAEHTTAEKPTSPPSNVTTLGPDTTPDFQPGTLDLEVTPPFNATVRQQQGSNGMARIPRAALPTDGPRRGSSDDHEFERPLRHHPRQQRPTASFRDGGLLLPTQPDDCPHRHTLLPLERRQLVFGGGGGTAEQQDFGNSYEEEPIGSECAGIGDGVSNSSGPRVEKGRYRGHALPGDSSAGTASAAADSDGTNADHNRTPRVMGQLGRASDPAEHTMRFFNDGFAVAQDGSPVVDGPLTATSSATTTVAASSVGGLVFPTNDYDNNRDTTGTQFGVRESGNAGGLPRFSIAGGLRDGNRSSPPATPAGLWKENMPSDFRGNRQYALESSASDCGPDFYGQAPAEEQVQPRGRHREDGSEVHHRSQGEYDSDLEQGPMLDHEDLMNPPSRDAAPPAFDMLARTWGLFGGALDARTPTAYDASGSNSAKVRDTSEERTVREASFRHGRDGKTGAPPLHASVPVRATPQAEVGQGDQSPEPNDANAEHPDAFESLQSPPPPSTPTSANDYDRGCEDGGGSPELMMHFCQGPELEVVVTGSQTGAEALEGETNSSSQPTEDGIPVTAGDTQNTPERQHEASMEMLVSPEPTDPKIGHNQEEGEQQPRQADLNTFTASQGPKSVAANERDVAALPANGGDAPTEPGGSGGIGGGGVSVGEDGGSIKTVSQGVMPPGDLQLRPGRSSTLNGSQSCAGHHEAAPGKPSLSPQTSAAVPSAEVPSSSYGQERKRARDAGEEEEGEVQGQDHPSEAGSKLPVRNGGGGFRAARLSGKARRLQLEVMKAPTCGSGEREGEFGDGNVRQGRMERDADSTIVWYQTIVACLDAPP